MNDAADNNRGNEVRNIGNGLHHTAQGAGAQLVDEQRQHDGRREREDQSGKTDGDGVAQKARKVRVREEIAEMQKKLYMVESMKRELKEIDNFTVESIGDIAQIMKQKNKLKRMRWMMILTGLPVTALQWVAIIFGITHGLWWLLAVWAGAAIPWGVFVSRYYFNHVQYICPVCHEVFKPHFKEAFWAHHTPRMRRLTCPKCGHKGMCIEVYAEHD